MTNHPSQAGERKAILRKFRVVLGVFILALILSGISAFPLQHELDLVTRVLGVDGAIAAGTASSLDRWLFTVREGLHDTYIRYPWLAYGTDWLAFGHIVIAIFFVGPLVNPVRNVWVLQAGLIACALVIPLALICGSIREIPFGWRLIDCSFGVIGAIPLYYCLRLARRMENRMKISE